jgi:hypothetical protein
VLHSLPGHLAIAITAALLAATSGCIEDPEPRHQGGPGFGCYFDADCSTPLICEETPAAAFPVCTGTALPGDACDAQVACAWLRDPDGLPLACADDGVCRFPTSELADDQLERGLER